MQRTYVINPLIFIFSDDGTAGTEHQRGESPPTLGALENGLDGNQESLILFLIVHYWVPSVDLHFLFLRLIRSKDQFNLYKTKQRKKERGR